MKTLIKELKSACPVQIDCCWSVIRDKKMGIKRKIEGWAFILDIEEEIALDEAIKDENGRIIDTVNRYAFHDELIKVSRKQNEN
jgi:hypothetical protein